MSGCVRRSGDLAERAGVLHAGDQRREGRQRALEAAFHAAVEHEVAVLVGDGFLGQLGRRLFGRRAGVRRVPPGAPGPPGPPPRRLLGA